MRYFVVEDEDAPPGLLDAADPPPEPLLLVEPEPLLLVEPEPPLLVDPEPPLLEVVPDPDVDEDDLLAPLPPGVTTVVSLRSSQAESAKAPRNIAA